MNEAGEADAAEKLLRDYLALGENFLDPFEPEIQMERIQLAELLLKQERLDTAAAELEAALAVLRKRLADPSDHPMDPSELNALSQVAYNLARQQFNTDPKSPQAGKLFQETLQLVGEGIAALPDNASLLVQHAWSLDSMARLVIRFDRRQEAIEATEQGVAILRRVVDENPDEASFKVDLAGLTCNRGIKLDASQHAQRRAAFEKAIELLQDALRKNPGDRRGLQFLGINADNLYEELLALGDDEAHRRLCVLLADALRPDSQSDIALRMAKICLSRADVDIDHAKLLKIVEKAVSNRRESHSNRVLLGIAQYRAGEDREAVATFEEDSKLRNPSPFYEAIEDAYRALALDRLQETSAAEKVRDEAVARFAKLARKPPGGRPALRDLERMEWKLVDRELEQAFANSGQTE